MTEMLRDKILRLVADASRGGAGSGTRLRARCYDGLCLHQLRERLENGAEIEHPQAAVQAHRGQYHVAREFAADDLAAHSVIYQLFESAGAGQSLKDGRQASLAKTAILRVDLLQRTAVRDERS